MHQMKQILCVAILVCNLIPLTGCIPASVKRDVSQKIGDGIHDFNADDPAPQNHLHIAVLDTSESSRDKVSPTDDGEKQPNVLVSHAIAAAILNQQLTHAMVLNWWTQSHTLTSDDLTNQSKKFKTALYQVKPQEGDHTAMETALLRIEEIVQEHHKKDEHMTFSVTLGTRGTDPINENEDRLKSQEIAKRLKTYNIKFLVHDVSGGVGAIDRIQKDLSPLGDRAIVCDSDSFNDSKVKFWNTNGMPPPDASPTP